jgi:EAL domain-containing protein (putative c-di-GMP-specific phosphodiesterase class I)
MGLGFTAEPASLAGVTCSSQVQRDITDVSDMVGCPSSICADLDAVAEFTDLIEQRAVSCAFQPVVRLDTREIVAYQALPRGPAGTRWESHRELCRAAAAVGRTAELDWVCQAAACEAALRRELPPSVPLLITADPATSRSSCPEDLRPTGELASDRLRVVTALTERAVSVDPVALVSAADSLRALGSGVALFDVGIDPGSLSLLPLMRPDLVRVDSYLLGGAGPVAPVAPVRAAVAVAEYAERSGAAVVADGIETPDHLARARGLGVSFGQGGLLGTPGPLPERVPVPLEPLRLPGDGGQPFGPQGVTPYDVVAVEREVTLTDQAALAAMARRLETMALDEDWPGVVLGCFQDSDGFFAATGRRYAALAEHAALVAVFGVGLSDEPAPGVLGMGVDAGDLLGDEWNLIVLGPRCAAALVARDLGDAGSAATRRYVHAVTYDRDLVIAAAQPLLARLAGSEGRAPHRSGVLTAW